ncbi:hypothetical protein QOZ80_2AG0107650 [Eleusine coracana subsp. coracana]|nr:hypothetical protein QOZ80_2AG0107650 [Eleusine coracana subsp. coracana]
MEECYHHVDLDQAMDLSELDGALLMEFMEDLPPSDLVDDGDVDRLSHVIRSLEAEIVHDGEATEAMVDDELSIRVPSGDGGRLEDMLDLDEYEGGSFPYWPDVPLEGHEEVDGWYMYMDGHEGSIAVHETVDHRNYYVENFAEQVYIPLWE